MSPRRLRRTGTRRPGTGIGNLLLLNMFHVMHRSMVRVEERNMLHVMRRSIRRVMKASMHLIKEGSMRLGRERNTRRITQRRMGRDIRRLRGRSLGIRRPVGSSIRSHGRSIRSRGSGGLGRLRFIRVIAGGSLCMRDIPG
jgi:hypothetical protein